MDKKAEDAQYRALIEILASIVTARIAQVSNGKS